MDLMVWTSQMNLRRRQWQPTPVLLPGESHGWRSLVGYSPWGCEELDITVQHHFQFSLFTFMHWRRKWQPTPVFLPGESQGWRSLVGWHLWGRTESDTTERLHFQFSLFTFMHWRRKWQPTPVFLPGESQGRRSLVGELQRIKGRKG